MKTDKDMDMNTVTILGFGSLLSETSAKTTFPDLKDFRLGRVNNYRRVFAHPASIFFQRGIVNYDTLEMSSLSAEYCAGSSFVCSIFEVSNENGEFMETERGNDDDNGTINDINNANMKTNASNQNPVASMAFREREEEFDIMLVPYEELTTESEAEVTDANLDTDTDELVTNKKVGILCCASTDEKYIKQWGTQRFENNYKKYNIDTIWNWKKNSGLRPCGPYLRHCVLASMKMGNVCYDSFLDDTYLVDRVTTVRSYLEDHPVVMDTLPPESLRERYGG